MANNDGLTVTLTNAPPVSIIKAEWPVVASADISEHDGDSGLEIRANRVTKRRITVRQCNRPGESGRWLVYGVWSFDSNHPNEKSSEERAGEYLDPGIAGITTLDMVVTSIRNVARSLYSQTDDPIFEKLARECVAELPAKAI